MSKIANVVFAYSPKNDDELELTVGDKIEILGYEEEGKCWSLFKMVELFQLASVLKLTPPLVDDAYSEINLIMDVPIYAPTIPLDILADHRATVLLNFLTNIHILVFLNFNLSTKTLLIITHCLAHKY